MFQRLAGALLLAASLAAAAQPAPPAATPSLAIYSQMAREVSLVRFQKATGSRLGNNLRERIPVQQGALDTVAVMAAGKVLRQSSPAAGLWLVGPTDEDLFDGLQNAAEGSKVEFPADMAAALRERGSTHLLLFTRHRADASFPIAYTSIGTGQIDGLGFYIDYQTELVRVGAGVASKGFLAPFAYFRSILVDVATPRILQSKKSTVSGVTTSSDTKVSSINPWNALTADQKAAVLRQLVEREIARVVPLLVPKP